MRILLKKKEGCGYHDRSRSIKKKLYKSHDSFAHTEEAGVVNDIAFLIANYRKRKLTLKKGGPRKLEKTPGPVCSYSIIQYILHTKNQMPFDPVLVFNHFVAKRACEQERSFDQRIRSRIAFFVESLTSGTLAKKALAHIIGSACFAGTTSTLPSFPFSFFIGATFLFQRQRGDKKRQRKRRKSHGNDLSIAAISIMESLRLADYRRKCLQMAKDKVVREQFISRGMIGEWRQMIEKIREMMMESVRKKSRSQYMKHLDSDDSYLDKKVKKMRSICSNRIKTNTFMESVKIKSLYQSASPIAQDISLQLRAKEARSVRSICSQIVRNHPRGIRGIRFSCSGRFKGAQIARIECYKYGKTSLEVLNQKIDYATATVGTRYGILGIKVWISYSQ